MVVGLDFEHSCGILAAAVIRRAIRDLTFHGRKAKLIRQDAHDFLVNRLWIDDCLWCDLAGPLFTRRAVLKAVDKALRKVS